MTDRGLALVSTEATSLWSSSVSSLLSAVLFLLPIAIINSSDDYFKNLQKNSGDTTLNRVGIVVMVAGVAKVATMIRVFAVAFGSIHTGLSSRLIIKQ